ncbi:unnamed protein product [Cyprideis torosa]|uniref:Isoaspartyl peptidase/L-asparaginase n=1 Tax=Cyprideis torosa TaxID=163714 RepID=A0A7R8WIV4_9CRUS|nr:unnamed protein product [Cyprideis torosa]CAG0898423.1 unnamed protein product [Cyprideis torosa]
MSQGSVAIAIHGGAGTIPRNSMTSEMDAELRSVLKETVESGYNILTQGGTALDAVEKVVLQMEDNPLFNAGKGSVFTSAGTHEMDAAVMEGHTLRCGGVTCVRGVRNPISLARAVMEKTRHVLLCGEGAEEFAREIGAPFEPPEYFFTKRRFDQLQRAIEKNVTRLDHSVDGKEVEGKTGTVGAVAVDQFGHTAAATSTGGMTNKRIGRVGDTPVPGAGNYANKFCAVSGTGVGEHFLRTLACYEVACRMEFGEMSLEEAGRGSICGGRFKEIDGSGGLVAVDTLGNVCLCFNTEGMYRAARSSKGVDVVAIYDDE